MRVRLAALVGIALACTSVAASGNGAASLSPMSGGDRARLLEALECPEAIVDRLARAKAGERADDVPPSGAVMCDLALDALCTASPQSPVCGDRDRTGAYAGYYLMRYTMPVVAMTRAALRSRHPDAADDAITDAGLESVFTILSLLSPELDGCGNLPRVRTWCTVTADGPRAVEPHRAAVAYLASEGVRLLAECRARGAGCAQSGERLDAALVRWFDVLLWDHALLGGTVLRNSLTQHVQVPVPASVRLHRMRDAYEASPGHRPAFRFATDGWWMAVAANLLAVDALLDGEDDPRPVALTEVQRAALGNLVELGTQVLAQRAERTQLRDFEGAAAEGLQFDARLWDAHEYRRFSAVDSGPRPFSVVLDGSAGAATIVFADGQARRAEGTGLDSGHYRRLTWLHYTLSDVQRGLQSDWVSQSALEGLANQFAYAVHWHDCHHRRAGGCDDASPPDAPSVPRFLNYVSGQRGWYRLTPSEPCAAGVPPYGFSTMMTISENLWWAAFNADVARIWGRLEAAVNDPQLPAPSSGDTVPCGEQAGTPHWHRTYRDTVLDADGRLTRHGLGFFAMKHWAGLALGRP